jgi:hypothetical protein
LSGDEVDEGAGVFLGEVLSVRRPGEIAGRCADERAVGEYFLDRERDRLGLSRQGKKGESKSRGKECGRIFQMKRPPRCGTHFLVRVSANGRYESGVGLLGAV